MSEAAAVSPDGETEHALMHAVTQAREAWPTFEMDEGLFVEHLARCIPADATACSDELAALQVADLFLAWACGRGDRAALAAFDTAYLAQLPAELRQHVFDLLFCGEEPDRKILQFAGRAPLKRWLSVVARNARVSLERESGRSVATQDQVLERLLPAQTEVESELVRRTHRTVVAAALKAALERLRPRDRRVLQLVLLNGISLAKVGRMFEVDASTVWHWVDRIRTQLREDVEEHLRARGIPMTELASIVRMLRSQIDVSLSGLSRP